MSTAAVAAFFGVFGIGVAGGAALQDAIPAWAYVLLLGGHCGVAWWANRQFRRDNARFVAEMKAIDAQMKVQNARMEGTLIGLQRELGHVEVTLQ